MPRELKPASDFPYTAKPVFQDGRLIDVVLRFGGKTRHAFGKSAAARERAAALHVAASGAVPVFAGAGLGEGIAAYLEAATGPVAVVDRQEPLLAATGAHARFRDNPRVRFIAAKSPQDAVKDLSAWLRAQGFPKAAAIADPAAARLDPELCRAVRERVESLCSPLFAQAYGYPRFAAKAPRILLLDSGYFVCGEIKAACARLGYPLACVATSGGNAQSERGEAGFVTRLLETARDFRPDFALCVNHIGLDREGALMGLFERMRLPLASWFVDSPRLILHDFSGLASPFAAVFTWDKDTVPGLAGFGFEHVSYLPLATDETRFNPAAAKTALPGFAGKVSFVGDSMLNPAAQNEQRLAGHPGLAELAKRLAPGFAASPTREARQYLAEHDAKGHAAYLALPGEDARLAFEMLLTWEAARLYRLARVSRLRPFSPLIAGDEGWKELLPGLGQTWNWHPGVDYYRDLPGIYASSQISFNTTSPQMKGAVNQRVFDVPACGGFVLTDAREQLSDLFEPDREIAVYDDPGEIEDLIRHYRANDSERTAITRDGRRRVLSEHTYAARLAALAATMRRIFG